MMRSILTYPRLIGLGVCTGAAYVLYQMGMFEWLDGRMHGFGYAGAFSAGLLFSYGFTSPFAIAALVAMAHEVNPFIAAPLAGIGAFLSDLVIFELLRVSFFGDELVRLRRSRLVDRIHDLLHRESTPERVRKWLLWFMAAIIIASPLPDEIGVALLSGMTTLNERSFAVICVSMNTLGIFIILTLSKLLQA